MWLSLYCSHQRQQTPQRDSSPSILSAIRQLFVLHQFLSLLLCWIVLFGIPARGWAQPPHVVWVVVDSWRWDHAGVYGPHSQFMPLLAERAQTACVFWRAYATSSWTKPSVASMFSGQYPSLHGVTTMQADMGPNVPHAAEMFSRAGYRTIAISANAFISRASGFARGFDKFVDPAELRPPGSKNKVRGEAVVEALDRSLREQTKTMPAPLFLYIHLMDPHWPYGPSDAVLSKVLPRFGDPLTLRQVVGEIYFGTLRLDRDISLPPVRNAVRALYAAEAAATDDVLRSLFEILDRYEVTPNAVVILTADHGEELFEHDHIGHGRTLHEEVVRVPLMIWFPHQRQRVDVHQLVSLVDLLPTSLRAARISFREEQGAFAGQSLTACAPPRWWTQRLSRWFWPPQCSASDRVVLAELFPLKSEPEHPPVHRAAVVRGTRKLLVGSDRALLGFEVDGVQDRERPSSLDPSAFQALEDAWREFEGRASAAGAKQREVTPDPATREQLRALGYDS
ncbi:MAG: hypothetical protein KatS3mg077_1398 [Candidatus Binatia bacterium]|nr:MAG: hypothetical protein KatS3mg077_1398 [Candidatus Binatia bacterium]